MGICIQKSNKPLKDVSKVTNLSNDERKNSAFLQPRKDFLDPTLFGSPRLIRNKSQNMPPTIIINESPAPFSSSSIVRNKSTNVSPNRSSPSSPSHRRTHSNCVLKTEKDVSLIQSALQKHFIFSSLSEAQISAIVNEMKLFTFASHSVIFQQDSIGDYYFVISGGKVEVLINMESVTVLGVGESFGEVALLHDAPRSATTIAVEKCYLWGLSRMEFREVIQKMNFQKYSENLRFIEEFQFFKTLTDKQKETLANCMHTETFQIGAKVIKEGEFGNSMYFIKEGSVVVTKKDIELRTLFKNEYFGEQALLNNNHRTASITALEPLICLSLSSDDLQATLGSDLQDIIHINTQRMAFNSDPTLKSLTHSQVNSIISKAKYTKHLKGTQILLANKLLSSIFIILKGKINSKTNSFKTLDIIGAQSLKNPNFVYPENLTATEDLELSEIQIQSIESEIGGKLEAVLERNSIIKVIRDMKVFRSLSEVNLSELAKMLTLGRFGKGTVIFTENSIGDCFYVIKSGNVVISKGNTMVREIGRLDYFGERALLLEKKRSATVMAKTDVECWMITEAQFSSVVDEQMRKRLLERIEMQDVSIEISDLCFVKVMSHTKSSTHFLCINPANSKLYILKSMQRNQFISELDQTNLISSKKLMLLVDHYFMVKLLKTFRNSIRLCMLFEYIPGMPFSEILQSQKQSLELNARFYTAALLLILEYLHHRDILHRYISINSIMIDTQGYPILIDFSCSKLIQNRTYTLVGPPHYLPPEAIVGDGYGHSADLWGLGISLYYMIFKKFPFGHNENDPIQIYQQILNYRLGFPATVDPLSKARHLLCELLNKKPSLRGNTEKAKCHPWFIGLNWDLLANKQLKAPFLPHPTEIEDDVKAALKKRKPVQELFCTYESGPDSYICRLNLNQKWDSDF